MNQKKISKRLNHITFLLAGMGLLFFVGKMSYSYYLFRHVSMPQLLEAELSALYMIGIYFGTLYQFYNVCRQIGNDNSFSLENVNAFHKMQQFGIAAAIGYVIRFIVSILLQVPVTSSILLIALFLLAIAFSVLCECLSQLIRNAYEVKTENELTI